MSSRSRSFGRLGAGRRAALLTAVGFAGAVGATLAQQRRWASNDDPTGGDPLRLGEGIDTVCVTDDGARLAVRVLGTGDAGDVVLPHCWMGNRRFWGPVAERLTSAGHRVVVYDQRGHGASTPGGAGCTIDALADDLEAVLRHVDARDAVVAGHSLGGMTTQAFLIRHPDVARRLVRGVVLVSTACDFSDSAERLKRVGPVFGAAMTPLYGNLVIGPLMLRSIEGREPVLSHLHAQGRTIVETPPEVRIAFLQAMAVMDLTEGLASVDHPVIVLVGERDTVTTRAQARRMAAAIPGARYEELPALGHMLLWEAPDRVVEAITELVSPINREGLPPGAASRTPRTGPPLRT